MSYIFNFEKLDVWQKARAFAKSLYMETKSFPADERFGLISQMRRAGVSVPSNIAEGNSRTSKKEKVHFFEIAYGSLMEVMNQLIISFDLGFVTGDRLDNYKKVVSEIANKLTALRKSHL